MSKVRQSNIELLRVIIMYMVLLLHANFLTFGYPEGCNTVSFFRIAAQSATIVAINVFVLITGYFGTTFRFSKIASIVYQLLFAVIPISCLFILSGICSCGSVHDIVSKFSFGTIGS